LPYQQTYYGPELRGLQKVSPFVCFIFWRECSATAELIFTRRLH